MRAAILVEQNKPLVVDAVELPRTLDYGQVLVKIFYSGICGSQIGEIDGVKGADNYLIYEVN
jgi:D-arabinose 1-dehydrogenase-like Zn-dependent alcohol dehydrogenase